jgi:putative ABC transport system permease protein
MLRYTFRSVLAAKGRLALSAGSIILGVGLVAGAFVLTDSAQAADDAAFTGTRGVAVVVRATAAGEGEIVAGNTRELFASRWMPATVADRVARIDGVAAATGVVSGEAQLLGRDGRVLNGRNPLGRSVDASFARHVRAGRLPGGPGEVVVDQASAAAQQLGVGARVKVVTSGGRIQTLTLVGILDAPEIPASVVLAGFDPATAQRLITRPGQISYLEVTGERGLGEQVLRDRVAAALGPGYEAFTNTTLAAELRANFGAIVQVGLYPGLVALVLGMFLIHNTFSLILASRTRELALLRCVGASRGWLRRSILLQSSIVGALASLAGVVFGVAVALGMRAVVNAVSDVDLPGSAPRMLPRTVAVALAVGVVTAVSSAWGPARRAIRVPPVTALRAEVFALDRRASQARTLIGALATLGGVATVLAGVLSDPARDSFIRAGGAAAVLGVLVLGPVLARSLSRLLGAPVGRARGIVGALARDNATRSPRRTAATVLPLVLGLALVGWLLTVEAGRKASTAGRFDRSFHADFRLEATGTDMSPQVAERLAGLPELASVTPVQVTAATVNGDPVVVTATDPAALARAVSLDGATQGAPLADLTSGSIAVIRHAPARGNPAIGSRVTLRTIQGERTFTVRTIYDFFSDRGEAPLAEYLITAEDLRRLPGDSDNSFQILVTAREGVTPGEARAAMGRALADYPTVGILSRDELRRQQSQGDAALLLVYAVIGFAIVIALFGIVNTLVLSILERVRELGLLRAIGMDRRQVRSMIRWEAILIAGIGTAIGLGLGAFLGWATTVALELPVTTVPLDTLALAAVAAVAVGVLAAALPARRAARVGMLRAIATQ